MASKQRKQYLIFATLLIISGWLFSDWTRGIHFSCSKSGLTAKSALADAWYYGLHREFDFRIPWWAVLAPIATYSYVLWITSSLIARRSICLRSVFLLTGMVACSFAPPCLRVARYADEIGILRSDIQKAVDKSAASGISNRYYSQLHEHYDAKAMDAFVQQHPFLMPWERKTARNRMLPRLKKLERSISTTEAATVQLFGNRLRIELDSKHKTRRRFRLVNNTDRTFGYTGYSFHDPWISVKVATDQGWTLLPGGYCGTGASQFYLDPGDETTFNAPSFENTKLEGRGIRVGVRLSDSRAPKSFIVWSQ